MQRRLVFEINGNGPGISSHPGKLVDDDGELRAIATMYDDVAANSDEASRDRPTETAT